MKLLHLADLHLGKRVNGFDMLEDQRFILEQILTLCDKHGVEAVVLAGDIYDTPVPPAAACTLLDWFLTQLSLRHVPVLAVSGNHDSAERLAVASRLLRSQGLYIFGPLDRLSPVILKDEWGLVAFLPMPYSEPARVRVMMNKLGMEEAEKVKTYEEAEKILSSRMLSLLPDEGKGMRKIALAHVYAAGGMSSESERPLSIGGYDQIPDEVFAPYDYTALGHLHRPQKTKRDSEKIQYSGSLMRYSFDEVRQKKGIIVGTIDGEGNVSTTFREMLPLHQVREIQGSFADIMAREGSEDYLQIVLTDSEPVIDAMPKLREKYPNALGVEQDMGYKDDDGERRIRLESMSDEDIFRAFVSHFREQELTEEEEKLSQEVWEEVYRKENAK